IRAPSAPRRRQPGRHGLLWQWSSPDYDHQLHRGSWSEKFCHLTAQFPAPVLPVLSTWANRLQTPSVQSDYADCSGRCLIVVSYLHQAWDYRPIECFKVAPETGAGYCDWFKLFDLAIWQSRLAARSVGEAGSARQKPMKKRSLVN